MLPRACEVEYLSEYRLLLTFTDGKRKIFGVEPFMWGEIFEPLKDKDYFKQVTIYHGTIRWPNDVEFCPDTPYIKGVPLESIYEKGA